MKIFTRWIQSFAMLLTLMALPLFSFAAPTISGRPLALVYKGPGSCYATTSTTGCSEAAANAATAAGFDVKYVGPQPEDFSDFQSAQVWIQPGGSVVEQERSMSDDLKTAIVGFVGAGGGYVGFCAGGFLATEKYGWQSPGKEAFVRNGLGLLPGQSLYFGGFDSKLTDQLHAQIVPTVWAGKTRFVYWELGPFFSDETLKGSEVLANYPKKKTGLPDPKRAMTLRSSYGLGRVFVTGVHPEAPQDWRDSYGLKDEDGLDTDLAVDMIRWSAGL